MFERARLRIKQCAGATRAEGDEHTSERHHPRVPRGENRADHHHGCCVTSYVLRVRAGPPRAGRTARDQARAARCKMAALCPPLWTHAVFPKPGPNRAPAAPRHPVPDTTMVATMGGCPVVDRLSWGKQRLPAGRLAESKYAAGRAG